MSTVRRDCTLVWFDPGETTGIFICSIRPGWIMGNGDPGFAGLRRAVLTYWHAQIGRDAKVWDDAKHHSAKSTNPTHTPTAKILDSARLPALRADELRLVWQMNHLLDEWSEAAWGYEDFIPRPTPGMASREAYSPMRLYSAVEAVQVLYSEQVRPAFVQDPSIAKTTVPDQRLIEAGLYRAGMPHANDAARHAITFLRRCRADKDGQLRHTAWPKIFKIT